MRRIICTVTNDLDFDQRMTRVCTTLSEQGYDVTLVGRSHSLSVPLSGTRLFRRVRLQLWFEKGKLFYLEYNLRLLFFLLTRPFDLVNAVDLDTLLPAWLATRFRRKLLVFDAHEHFPEVPELVGRPLTRKAWQLLANLLVPRVDFAYTVNGSLAEIFRKQHGVPFAVVRNVPFQRKAAIQPPGLRQKPFIMLYQGVLNEGRGLEAAILAMRELEDAQLWLAGEGDLSQQLRELVKQEGLGGKVTFLGRILPPDLAELTSRAHLGLNLLEGRGASYYYSLANKAFDYIQAGVPSLEMDYPEYRRINEEHDVFLLLDDLSAAAVAGQVEALRRDEERYEKLQSNCIAAARALNWEREKIVLINVYEGAAAMLR